MPETTLLALVLGLILALLAVSCWLWLRGMRRGAAAHTESRSQTRVAAATAAAEPQTPAQGPVAALMSYTKADGSTSERRLQILSRNGSDGAFTALNCRMEGERIVKSFLLRGIGRLVIPDPTPALVLTTPEEIRAWLEHHIPERQPTPTQQRQAPEPEQESHQVAPVSSPPPPPPPPPPQRPTPLPLASLLPQGARGFAVLDLETTGVGRSCRIVEIALVRLDPQGRITEEWETLVHPGIPIPNAMVHGIDDALVAGAPSFTEIAGVLAGKLHEHVLVAHNLHNFDGPILEAHFLQVEGVELSLGKGVDTMPRPKLKLAELCARHGVELEAARAHTALGDTQALAMALQRGMAHLTAAEAMVVVHHNGLLNQPCTPITRGEATTSDQASPWEPIDLQLQAGQMFHATGPQAVGKDTMIRRGEAHASSLGLTYRKVDKIGVKSVPAFLLSTSLDLQNSKMAAARERQIPVVLCEDLMQAQAGSIVRAWVHRQEGGGT